MQLVPYEALGGEVAVRKLVDRFYDLMDSLPEAAGIRALHPEDLASSRDKLFMFLTGWLGGPPLYTSKYGHPRLRARHLPFSIGTSERDQWMFCMTRAITEADFGDDMKKFLVEKLGPLADFMRNTEESGA